MNSLFFFTYKFFLLSFSLSYGEILFDTNCSSCHLGGTNVILPEKNLKKDTLESNGLNTLDAITYQIINGKNGMPAFGGRLSEKDIKEIATYILLNF